MFNYLEFKDVYKIKWGKMVSLKDANKDSILLVRKAS